MSDHYFEAEPRSASRRRVVEETVRGVTMRLATDNGVFSKNGLDPGSRLMIESAEIRPGARVLDLGCGYGPVGIAIALIAPSALVWMVDINERAIALARANIEANQLSERCHAWRSDGVAALPEELAFQAVLLNPPIRAGKSTVQRLFRDASRRLTGDGRLYTVVRKQQGADSVFRYLIDLYGNATVVAKAKGYRVFLCRFGDVPATVRRDENDA